MIIKYSVEIRLLVWSSLLFLLSAITGCDRNSSPEGRMSIKIENLQKEMFDSLEHQNRAMLDSLEKIREELNEIKRGQKPGTGKK